MDKVDEIYIILGKERDSNCYIFGETMVDPGTGFYNSYVEDSIKEAGMSMDDIKRIVNTHCHYDHMGADKYFQDTYGYDIYMHPEDKAFIESGDRAACCATSFDSQVPDLDIKDLNEDDEIDGFSVIHTPGHTRGGICLYNGKSLITGDTLFSGGNFGRTDLPSGSTEQMRDSIHKLSELDVVQLFPGHGPYAITAVPEQMSLALMIASRL